MIMYIITFNDYLQSIQHNQNTLGKYMKRAFLCNQEMKNNVFFGKNKSCCFHLVSKQIWKFEIQKFVLYRVRDKRKLMGTFKDHTSSQKHFSLITNSKRLKLWYLSGSNEHSWPNTNRINLNIILFT
jgi:hypothetical protein